MTKSRLFQVAVLWHPNEKQEEKGEKSKVLVDLETILSADDKSALIQASRKIPEKYLEELDQVEIVCRPF